MNVTNIADRTLGIAEQPGKEHRSDPEVPETKLRREARQ